MELLSGMTLRDEIKRNAPLDSARTLQVFRGLCSAVGGAHRRLLIHRDLKPDNIFLARTAEGREVVKVLDFGIAKFLSGDVAADPGAMGETTVGLLVGTPNYISPEQLMGERSDVHSDIWALAVTAYECLTGALPFPTGNRDDWRRAVLAGCYTPLDEHLPDPPQRLRAFFADCLSVDRAQRPRTAEDFLVRLERGLDR
jgi:serine/threonine-protein kinase